MNVPTPREPPGRDAGFTLLEVMVALVVLGFLLVGLSGGVRLGLRGWDQQSRGAAAHADLDAVDTALRRLVAGVDPGDRTRPAGLAGTATELRLTTALPASLSNAEADAVLLVQNGVLLLRWQLRLPGIATQPPPPPEQMEMLSGLTGMQVTYWGANGWQNAWDSAEPPRLVRVSLLFPTADPAKRHWPPLVVAPARVRDAR